MKKELILYILVLGASMASAQPDAIQRITGSLAAWQKGNPRFKINLFFNQPAYVPGDTAFFSCRFVYATELTAVPGEQLLHLVLIDEQGKEAIQQLFFVVDGVASNQIILPPALQPGLYRLV